jgi:hypothetical protein
MTPIANPSPKVCKYILTHAFTSTLYYTLSTSAKFWFLQTKGAAMKNVAHPMNIDIDSSSDDSDFVQPPPKRNRGPEQQACNIPQQPPRPVATHTDREPATKKTDKVSSLLLIADNKKGCLCIVLYLLATQSHICTMYMWHQLHHSICQRNNHMQKYGI